ncbi:MAG: aspartate 1-decarboxylase [Cyanobacteria bacterium P01_G01_bin.54]
MSAKLHRFCVTSTHKDYIGSITIDENLLDRVGILPLEEVEIVNINNGNRWSTYVLPGEKGSGCICPNGGGAILCSVGDVLIIFSYVYLERDEVIRSGHRAKIICSEENNQIGKFFFQEIISENGKLGFNSVEKSGMTQPTNANISTS